MIFSKNSRSKEFLCGLLVCFSLIGISSEASNDLTPTEILQSAKEDYATGKKLTGEQAIERYENAVAGMLEYIDILKSSKQNRVIARVQDVRFKVAVILISDLNRPEDATKILQDYVDYPLADRPRKALDMLSLSYYKSENYAKCVATVTNALYYNENPVVVAEVSTGRDEDEEDDEGIEDDEEIDPEYTQDQLNALHMRLAESYFKLKQWKQCIEPFSYVVANTTNPQHQGYAIMQLIEALSNAKEFNRIIEWVPQLYRSDSRYDIRVNLGLMKAANELYKFKMYDSALPLYRMILPRDEILEFQRQRLRDMRVAAGLPPELGGTVSSDEMTLFGGDDTTKAQSVEEVVDTAELEEQVPDEIQELSNLITVLENAPPYEQLVKFRMAEVYRDVDRFWEGVIFYDDTYIAAPESQLGERSIYNQVEILLSNLDDINEAEKKGFAYLDGCKEGMYPRLVAYSFSRYHQIKNNYKAVKPLKPYLDGFIRTNDTDIVQLDVELYFIQAIADLIDMKYEEAEAGFKYINSEFPQSHQEGACVYWCGMAQLFSQKYTEALASFEDYSTRFASEDLASEAAFRAGLCHVGLGEYDKALNKFSYVIDIYPESDIYADAHNMRGDIYGMKGDDLLDAAIADYKKANKISMTVDSRRSVKQSSYATFKMADIFEAEDKYDEILQVVTEYKNFWDAEADIAKALFWIGKSMIKKQRYDDAVSTYMDAIVTYGSDLQQEGVDLMIDELVTISQRYLNAEKLDVLRSVLQEKVSAAENMTLKLRLQVLAALINKTELELGAELLTSLESFEHASPPVLSVICDASFNAEDYSRSTEIFDLFMKNFEESEYMRAAYKLKSYGQYANKDYEGALETAILAQETYNSMDRDMSWAQLMRGQVLLDQSILDGDEGARQVYLDVLKVSQWRGEPVAEATFKLGQVEEKSGKLLDAFAFYQRVYIQYKGHAGGFWAAEAYLASADVLEKLGPEYANDRRNTYRAMLFDRYVNSLPQADVARTFLGATEVAEINNYVQGGGSTNITIAVKSESIEDRKSAETEDGE
ncbi:MAG TPA: tetratricopeptide repeat protein [Pontiella sp.]